VRMARLIKEGIGSLGTNKSRTVYMMAGTVIGISALMVIMAIGKGTEREVMERVANFGTHAVMVTAGGGRGFSPPQEGVTTLRLEDAEAIRNQVSHTALVSPAALKRGMTFRAGAAQARATVFAVEPEWHDAWDWHVADGDPITPEDLATMQRSCVLGSSLSRELFGSADDPIGEDIQIGNVRFRVKGVLESKGTSPMGSDFDNRAIIPLTTGLRRVFNQDHLSFIRVKVADSRYLAAVGEEIRNLLRQRHQITPPREDDFSIVTAADAAEMARGISGTLSVLLIALVGVSLIAGGIVLMNILLIAVSERTGEIGLRRALGATERDVFVQFLTESLAVTFLGMLLGAALGWIVGVAAGMILEMPVAISWEPFALGAAFSVMVGLFFGIQPARRAARLSPVDALR
jgi:putative ABC transport system permease protein